MPLTERPFDQIPPGKKISASEFNRLSQTARRASQIDAPGAISNQTSTVIPAYEPPWIYAKLTAKDGSTPKKYSWTRAWPDGIGGWTLIPETVGTTTSLPAYQANGKNADINIYVKLYYGSDNAMWFYEETGVAGELEIKEQDGTPDYTSTTIIIVDQADGFSLSQPGAGQVRIDILAATETQAGIVSTTEQNYAGLKRFNDDIYVVGNGIIAPSIIHMGNDPSLGGSTALIFSNRISSGTAYNDLNLQASADSGPTVGAGLNPLANSSAGEFQLSSSDLAIYPRYTTARNGTVQTGQTGTILSGAAATGGIVTSLGSGTFGTLTSVVFGDGLSGGTVTTTGTVGLAAIAGLSALGNSTNSSAVPTAITAANDAEVLRRSGTTLGFGTVVTAGIADGAITDAKLRDSAALSVIGRSANSSGDPADIAATEGDGGGILVFDDTSDDLYWLQGGTEGRAPVINSSNNVSWELVFLWVSAPASASSTGVPGQMAFDGSFLYVCTASNTWKRVAIATW